MNIRIAAVAALVLTTLATTAEAKRSHHYRAPQQPIYDYSAHTKNSYATGNYAYYGPVTEKSSNSERFSRAQLRNKQISSKHGKLARNSGNYRKKSEAGIRKATSSRAYKRLTRKLANAHSGSESSNSERFAKVRTSSGQVAIVIASARDKFQGFIDAVEAAGYKIKDIGCKSWGHMRNSKHHWGGACDFDQKRRSVTAKFMYHVTEIAKRFGLTDGCTWHPADCGHIEVPGPNSPHRNQYAMR